MCTRIFLDPANRYGRSPDNPAQSNDNDRKAGKRAAQTFATKKAVHAVTEASARPSVRLRDKRSTTRRSAPCDKQWHVRYAPCPILSAQSPRLRSSKQEQFRSRQANLTSPTTPVCS